MIFQEVNEEAIDSRSYFINNDYEESQVISLSYNLGKKNVYFVVRFARTQEFVEWLKGGKKPEPPISDFRLLVFEGVENFEIDTELKNNPLKITKDGLNYNSKNPGAFMVEYVELEN